MIRLFSRDHLNKAAAALSAFLMAAPCVSTANYQAKTEAPAKTDPLQIVISLNEQQLRLYRGDQLLSTSRVSTGKRRYRTPRGVYSIIQKRRRHYSNLYRGAPMPYMQRITWSGLALHQGPVPNYPASHGCVRLPRGFARKLFGMTEIGGGVIITRERQAPFSVSHPNLFAHRKPTLFAQTPAGLKSHSKTVAPYLLSSANIGAALAFAERYALRSSNSDGAAAPSATMAAMSGVTDLFPGSSDDPVRVLILASAKDTDVRAAQRILAGHGYDAGEPDGLLGRQTARAVRAFQTDYGLPASGTLNPETIQALYHSSGEERPSGHLYVRRGRQDLFDAPVEFKDPEQRIGTHLFTAMAFDGAQGWGETAEAPWTALTVDDAEGAEGADTVSVLDRVVIPDAVRKKIETMLRPGSTVIISDAGYGWETGKGTDFIVQPR